MKTYQTKPNSKPGRAAADSLPLKSSGPGAGSSKQMPAMQAKEKETGADKVNKTGLPDHLKSGVERLSGYSMDDVRVIYGSNKPAQLKAYAYAQGTEIHVAAGQEKHLAHEAWHVVQQKQGRVKRTAQMKGKYPVNSEIDLEKEADVMGAKAMGMAPDAVYDHAQAGQTALKTVQLSSTDAPVQRIPMEEFMSSKFLLKDHIPSFGMGRFDLELMPQEGVANIVVNMFVNFSNEQVEEGTTPWTEREMIKWKADAHEAVKKVWNNIAQFSIETEDWPPVKIKPRFDVSFIDDRDAAHVVTNAVKIPQPGRSIGMWNGGRNGLYQDQYQHGPMTPTRADLSDIAPDFRNNTLSGVSHHNIFAHEFGHMIGLSDEYNQEVEKQDGPGMRQRGNMELMDKYGAPQPEWGVHTQSLMSDGTRLLMRHFVTVQEALENITATMLPGSTLLMSIREGNPIWMELDKERRRFTEVMHEIWPTDNHWELLRIQEAVERELEYERAQLAETDGDMRKLAEFLGNLHAQRSEYMETFILNMLEKIHWRDVANNDTLQSFLIDFRTIPWNE